MVGQLFPHANNFVKNIVFGDCATPWFVYVETFFPAFIKLLINQNLLLWDDVVRSIAEEKAGTRRRRGIRGGRHGRLNLLRNEATERERYARRGLRTLLTITQPLETIGYIVLLWSAADRFYYDWQTLIQVRGPCSSPPAFRPFQRSRTGGANVPILPAGAAMPLPINDQNDPGFSNNTFSVGLPAGTYDAFWNANVKGPSGGSSGNRASLRITNSPSSPTILGEATDLASGQEATLGLEASFTVLNPGGSVGWELTGPAVPVGLACSSARFIVMRSV